MTESTVKPEEKKKEEYTYEEVHSTPITDIIPNRQIEPVGDGEKVVDPNEKPGDNATDTPKDVPVVDETTKTDDKPNEQDKTATASPPVDVEKIASETAKKTAEEMVKALVGDDATKKEKDDLESKLQTALKEQPWVKENRNPSYAEMAGFLAKHTSETVKEQVKRELQQEVEEEDKNEREAQTQQVENNKAFATKWDDEFVQLEKLGHKLDNVAKLKIFEIMKGRNLNGRPTDSILTVFAEDYKPTMDKLEEQKKSPVAGATHGGAASNNSQTYTYADIHGAKTEEILKEVRG